MPKKYNLRFMQLADVHLGKKQYGLYERAEDFSKAFDWVCNEAIEKDVDFVLISGDLFDKRSVDAYTLRQAKHALQELKDAEIKVFLIAGNHDKPYYKDRMGWLFYLQLDNLITEITKDTFTVYKGCRILSLGDGSRINIIDKDFDIIFDDEGFNIFMLHAGLESIIPNMTGCISKDEVEKLKPYCDYLALGHVHKPYEMDGWIFNPGSLEHWNISESNWNGGYYLVDVDTTTKKFNTKHVLSPKRGMIRVNAEIDPNHEDYLLISNFDGAPDSNSIFEITLVGVTKKKPNIENIKKNFFPGSNLFYIKVVDKTKRPGSLNSEHSTKDKTSIEREVIDSLTQSERLTDVILELKNRINDDPKELLEVIQNV